MKKLIALQVLNVAVSGSVLIVALAAANKAHHEIEELKTRANETTKKMRRMLDDMEF